MHQKKSEAQIGKESSGVSSDFNPNPKSQIPVPFSSPTQTLKSHFEPPKSPHAVDAPTPYKRPLLHPPPPASLSKSPTLIRFRNDVVSRAQRGPPPLRSAVFRVARRVNRLRRGAVILSLPFFYFLVSRRSQSLVVDFLSAFAFSAAVLALPWIRVFVWARLARRGGRARGPVVWSIGARGRRTEAESGSGYWVQGYGNGDVYEGEVHKGKCTGSGVYYYWRSGRYEGEWVEGKYEGFGVETWARGSRFRGQYSRGLRHGFGVYRFYTGDVYAGQWSNGQSHGCGVHTCEDGSRYVGLFKWGLKHGLGHYHFRNGDTYSGEYFADKMHGFGVYKFANGHRYEGAWHEGKRQGLGMYTFRNGEQQSGHWQNGVLDIPSTQNTTYPVSPVGVYHSKILNAVQEARCAAEKSYDVAKVDERVNRAVAAANRAATAARVASVKAVQSQMHQNNAAYSLV